MAVEKNGNQLNLGKVVAAYTAHKALKARQAQASANLKLKQDQLKNRKDEFKKRQEQRDRFHKDDMKHKATVIKQRQDNFNKKLEHQKEVLEEQKIARKTRNKLAGARYEELKIHNKTMENTKKQTLNEYARDIDNKTNLTQAMVNKAQETTYQMQHGEPSKNTYQWNSSTRPGPKVNLNGNARDQYFGKGQFSFGGKKGAKDKYHTDNDFKSSGGAI